MDSATSSSSSIPSEKPVSTTPDKTLQCKECSKEFTFSGGEQDFYAAKGFSTDPQRCPDCRRARKAAIRSRGRGRGRGRGGRGGSIRSSNGSNGNGNGNGAPVQPPAGAQPGQCYAFLSGSCRYGDSCRYRHV